MRLFKVRSDTLAAGLAIAVAGVIATETRDWVQSHSPTLGKGWLWVVLSVLLLLLAFLAFVVIKQVLFALGAAALTIFAPRRVAARIPFFLGGRALDTDASMLDAAAYTWSERVFRPALPAIAAELKALRAGTTNERGEPLTETVRLMTARWSPQDPFEGVSPRESTYVDPIHGTIAFHPDFAWLLTHPLTQRLNEIRQLPFAFPRFPGGTHTRFSHSIGVAHLAGKAVRSVLNAGLLYTPEGAIPIELSVAEQDRLVRLATAAGLVHDLGHPPLGHTLDRFFKTRYFEGEGTSDADKEFLPRLLGQLEEPIRAVGLRVDELTGILAGVDLTNWNVFLSQLVNSRLDVDRIDYLQRDAHFTGQREGLLNVDALLSAIRPFKTGDNVFLTFDEAYLSDVEQFVYARDVMYLRCYEHPRKVLSEALTLRSVKRMFDRDEALTRDLRSFALLTDAQVLEILSTFSRSGDAELTENVRRAFRSGAVQFDQVDSVPFVEGLVEGWLGGLLADFTLEAKTLLDKVDDTEARIARAAGVDPQDLVLILPDPKANEERSLALDIRILTKDGSGYKAVPLLSEKDDNSPSEVLKRRKFVSLEVVQAATDLDELKRTAGKGISLLGIIRSARFRLRLFVHRRSAEKADALKNAFRSLGVRNGDQT